MDDGRTERFERDETGADRLAHGYATTVHRAQGATCDATFAFNDGGGRELAYVAMSRGRENNVCVTVADDLDQAKDDLVRDWANERRWHWAIDQEAATSTTSELALERARLASDRAAQALVIPPERTKERDAADREFTTARQHLDELRAGTGPYATEEIAEAATEVRWVEAQQRDARYRATSSYERRDRRAAERQVRTLDTELEVAKGHLADLIAPAEQQLVEQVTTAWRRLSELDNYQRWRETWTTEHPGAESRLATTTARIGRITNELSVRRNQAILAAEAPAAAAAPRTQLAPPNVTSGAGLPTLGVLRTTGPGPGLRHRSVKESFLLDRFF